MKTLYEDFVKLQAELPSVMKEATGQVGNQKFKYADLQIIVETIRPILLKHGFAFMQTLETITDATYIITTLIHKSGETVSSKTRIDYPGDDIKRFGAAVTYYRRYALQSMLGIVADADADDDKDSIGKKQNAAHVPETKATEADKLKQFCALYSDKYAAQSVVAHLNMMSTTHKCSVFALIDRYIIEPALYEKHINDFLFTVKN